MASVKSGNRGKVLKVDTRGAVQAARAKAPKEGAARLGGSVAHVTEGGEAGLCSRGAVKRWAARRPGGTPVLTQLKWRTTEGLEWTL